MIDINIIKYNCPWVTMREKRCKDRNEEDDTVHIWFEELYYCKATGMECNEDNCTPLYFIRKMTEAKEEYYKKKLYDLENISDAGDNRGN